MYEWLISTDGPGAAASCRRRADGRFHRLGWIWIFVHLWLSRNQTDQNPGRKLTWPQKGAISDYVKCYSFCNKDCAFIIYSSGCNIQLLKSIPKSFPSLRRSHLLPVVSMATWPCLLTSCSLSNPPGGWSGSLQLSLLNSCFFPLNGLQETANHDAIMKFYLKLWKFTSLQSQTNCCLQSLVPVGDVCSGHLSTTISPGHFCNLHGKVAENPTASSLVSECVQFWHFSAQRTVNAPLCMSTHVFLLFMH